MTITGLLARTFVSGHPRQAAERLERAPTEEVAGLLADLDDGVVFEALQHVDPHSAADILGTVPDRRRRALLGKIPPRRAALVLRAAGSETGEAWVAGLPADLARPLRAALSFPADSVANVMDPAVLTVPADATVRQARERIARRPKRALYYLYVVDAERRPVGVVTLRDLISAAAATPVATLMRQPVLTVSARTDVTLAAVHPGWETLHALPVVDDDGILVGVLRYETGERLRMQDEDARAAGGVGVALTEALWTWTAHVVDEVAGAVQRGSDHGD